MLEATFRRDTALLAHCWQLSAIANAFLRDGMIEARGRGIEKVLACKMQKVETPSLHFEAPGLWVEFRYPDSSMANGTSTTQETTQDIPQKILAILREKPTASRREIATILTEITEDAGAI